MARFERSRERKGRRDSGRRNSNRESPDRGPKRYSRNRRDFEMTEVTCSSCGAECKVPFKPTSTKPVYCDDCFAKKGKSSSNKSSDKNFTIINEKLDKIMNALEIK